MTPYLLCDQQRWRQNDFVYVSILNLRTDSPLTDLLLWCCEERKPTYSSNTLQNKLGASKWVAQDMPIEKVSLKATLPITFTLSGKSQDCKTSQGKFLQICKIVTSYSHNEPFMDWFSLSILDRWQWPQNQVCNTWEPFLWMHNIWECSRFVDNFLDHLIEQEILHY